MSPSAAFCALAFLLAAVAPAAWTQTTVRPYKFGFIIDEQQHRSEKRDERGIVMGEFGFITADGIYHVTVYATDEEGKFRILAMRNYPYESPPKTFDMLLKPEKKAIATTTTTTTTPSPKKVLPNFNFAHEACSGCFLTNNVPAAPQQPEPEQEARTPIRPLSKALAPNGVAAQAPGGKPLGGPAPGPTKPRLPIKPSQPSTVKAPGSTATKTGGSAVVPRPTANTVGVGKPPGSAAANDLSRGTNPAGRASSVGKAPQQKGSSSKPATTPPGARALAPRFGGAAGGNAGGGGGGGKVAAGVKGGAGGESGDLYRFKYILDHNGHTETGARNGNKVGNFYAIGDDNVERTIEYTANEFGYQPRIHWRRLDAPPPSKANTLKEYEFVWFKQPQQ